MFGWRGKVCRVMQHIIVAWHTALRGYATSSLLHCVLIKVFMQHLFFVALRTHNGVMQHLFFVAFARPRVINERCLTLDKIRLVPDIRRGFFHIPP
jgi:hypothetical protein